MKLITLDLLKKFWDNVKNYFQPKIDKIDKKVWMGKEEDLEAAIEAGLVDETTTIVITDGDAGATYQFCTYSDILALFPEFS